MFSNVLVALKEGAVPEQLIDLATSVATPGARVHLVTFLRAGTQEDELARLEATRTHLEEQAGALRGKGLDATSEVGAIAAAASFEVLHSAEDRDSDLIVIGLGKRSRVGKALMGSDAQRILIGAQIPVLAARLEEAV